MMPFDPQQPPLWAGEHSPPGARPAATLILMRDVPEGTAEILFLQRAHSMTFAAGAIVFPGGAVDPGDLDLAARVGGGLGLEDVASRIAAIRETIEEAGVAVGFADPLAPGQVAAIRDGLHRGEAFGDLLDSHGAELDLGALTLMARWCPARQGGLKSVYDTRFYVARVDADVSPTVDATENLRLRWASARQLLADCEAGIEQLLYPTRRNLERLALARGHDELVAHIAGYPVEMITPWVEERDGEPHLCIPGHLGYPVTSQLVAKARRS